MRRVSIINQKGGVGKTTTAANLGAALANSGWRVLLIDLDPQSHLTMHYVVDLDEDRPTIYDVMTSSCTIDEAALAVRENIRLVPSDVDLAGAETELAQASGRQIILRDAVEPIAADYDIMLIDCPPSVGLLTVNALAATYEMLIPLQPHFLPLQGLAKLHETVTLVHRHINSRLRIAGIVICIHDAGTRLAGEVIEDLEQFLQAFRAVGAAWSDARLFNTRIRRNVKLAESPSHGKTIFDYAPTSHGAQDYANLAAEIFGTEQVEAFSPLLMAWLVGVDVCGDPFAKAARFARGDSRRRQGHSFPVVLRVDHARGPSADSRKEGSRLLHVARLGRRLPALRRGRRVVAEVGVCESDTEHPRLAG